MRDPFPTIGKTMHLIAYPEKVPSRFCSDNIWLRKKRSRRDDDSNLRGPHHAGCACTCTLENVGNLQCQYFRRKLPKLRLSTDR